MQFSEEVGSLGLPNGRGQLPLSEVRPRLQVLLRFSGFVDDGGEFADVDPWPGGGLSLVGPLVHGFKFHFGVELGHQRDIVAFVLVLLLEGQSAPLGALPVLVEPVQKRVHLSLFKVTRGR